MTDRGRAILWVEDKLAGVTLMRTASKPGIDSYFQKPMDFDVFSLAVRQPGLYWIGLNSNPPAPEAGQ